MALRGTPPSTPKVSRGQLSPPLVAPPGLDLPPGLTMLPAPMDAERQEAAVQMAKEVLQHTDAQMDLKVGEMLLKQQEELKLFDKQKDEYTQVLEEDLRHCRDKVAFLEADRESMKQTLSVLQAQMNAMSSQLGFGTFPMPSPPLMSTPPPAVGNFMNMDSLGYLGQFPSGFLPVPAFPFGMDEVDASQPQSGAPSFVFSAESMSAPPTPTRAPVAPPAMAPPPAPTAGPLQKASVPISISDAIVNTSTTSETGSGGKDQAPCDSAAEAFRLMMQQPQDDADAKAPHQCLTPVRQSPGNSKTLSGTPSRTLQSSPHFPTLFGSPSKTTMFGSPGKTNLLASPNKLNITPKRTPRSSGKMAPGMRSPSIMSSPFVICESGGIVFEFTLRVAEDFVVGINIEHSEDLPSLKVTGIVPGGAMEAWNRQCTGGPSAGKEVMPGDYIVKVNQCAEPQAMLKECREQKLLRFTVTRGEIESDIDPLWSTQKQLSNRGNLSSIFASPKRFSANQELKSP